MRKGLFRFWLFVSVCGFAFTASLVMLAFNAQDDKTVTAGIFSLQYLLSLAIWWFAYWVVVGFCKNKKKEETE